MTRRSQGSRTGRPRKTPKDPTRTQPSLPGYRPPQELLLDLVELAWSHGWQPHELHRQLRRQADRAAIELGELILAIDHASRPGDAYHPQWQAQIDELGLPPVAAISATSVASAEPGLLAQVMEAWMKTGPLPVLLPPPAGVAIKSVVDLGSGAEAGGSGVPDPVLEKVRALLDKAEATNFPAEAESFTAKAHELIARHSIDDALLARGRNGAGSSGGSVVTVRIPIDAPYAKSKYLLVQLVAEAGGCRAVYHTSAALSSVVGHAKDVAAVEMLYTSLLVQAQTALNAEGTDTRSGDRRRSRGYRSSFLLAYAHRIGERLEDVRHDVRQQAEAAAVASGGTSLVPVLAARDQDVAAHFDDLFSDVRSTRVSGGSDAFGWASGHQAANQASLGAPKVGSRPVLGRGR